jgi:hypothetical protein
MKSMSELVAQELCRLIVASNDSMLEPRNIITESGQHLIAKLSKRKPMTKLESRFKLTITTPNRITVESIILTPDRLIQLHDEIHRYTKRPKHITRMTAHTDQQHANAAD